MFYSIFAALFLIKFFNKPTYYQARRLKFLHGLKHKYYSFPKKCAHTKIFAHTDCKILEETLPGAVSKRGPISNKNFFFLFFWLKAILHPCKLKLKNYPKKVCPNGQVAT